MRAALRWIAGNVPLMVLALALSVVAWFVAVEAEDPTNTARYAEAIPVVVSGLPDGMVLLETSSRAVLLDIRATQSVWNSLAADDFGATIDVTGLGSGVHTVPVDLRLSKEPARILAIEPNTITVKLEYRLERSVPVRIEVDGDQSVGYLRRSPTVVPDNITVSGPTSEVGWVAEAVVVVSVQGATSDVEGSFPVSVLDEQGQPVPGVVVSPDRVSVRVPIELSDYYRFLVVKVAIEGQVAENHRITDITVDPPTVTVFGTPDVIAALPGFIETQPISVAGATMDIIERPALTLPPAVSLVSGQKPVEVHVAVEPVLGSTTVNIPPTIQGLGPSLTATIPLDSIAVVLSGPLPVLEALEPGDVRIILDLFALLAGKHEIEPRVVLPEGLSAQSIFPPVIQVEVFVNITPTPTLPATEIE